MRVLLASILLASMGASAASRPRAGGTLTIAVVGSAPSHSPLLADSATDVALSPLLASPLCRWELDQPTWVLARGATWSSPTTLRVDLRPAPLRADGNRLSPSDVALAFRRISSAPSPYRGLLAALTPQGPNAEGDTLTFPLQFPFPELPAALCHPALAPASDSHVDGVGPFRPGSSPLVFLANPTFPEGRPWADALQLLPTDARLAERALAQRRAQLALGVASSAPVAMGRATFLQWRPDAVASTFRAALEATVDREELVHFFIKAPAAPLFGLLAGSTAPTPAAAPARQFPPRPLTLVFDQSDDQHRALATRLQVKLDAQGYRLSLKGVPRAELRARWDTGDGDLFLHGVWLPPQPVLALAIALELAGKGLAAKHLAALPLLGRDEAARALAQTLGPALPLFPLAIQGVGLKSLPSLPPITRDGAGIPRLDDLPLGGD